MMISIVGMGLSPKDLTEEHQNKINKADIIIGGERHLEIFKDSNAEKLVINKNLKELTRKIKERMAENNIVVLTSGDPLFYGIGSYLAKNIGKENVEIFPNVTSVGAAFSKIKEAWSDAEVISLHGRDLDSELIGKIQNSEKIAIYTDNKNNPSSIASKLIKEGITSLEMCVLEKLGYEDEKVQWYSLQEASKLNFTDPNIIIIKKKEMSDKSSMKKLYPGSPDVWFEHQRGLITKSEVRAVTISKLRLSDEHIFWDLGAGSGSVSVEASIFVKTGKIISVEKDPERVEMIRRNQNKFNVNNMEVINLELPEGLESLPDPDRVFIGGGGKNLGLIIRKVSEKLKPSGRIIINTVLLENIDVALKTLEEEGFENETVQVNISRSKAMPWGQRLEAQNPVWVISGEK